VKMFCYVTSTRSGARIRLEGPCEMRTDKNFWFWRNAG